MSSRVGLIEWEVWYRTDRGASFCHVRRIRPDDRGIPWVTSGTQKWNGDRPSFITRARVMTVDASGFVMFVTVHWPEYRRLVTIASMSSIDAVAWVRKYFVAASTARGLCCFISTGIMANMFISKPIQTRSQWELVITIIVPRIIVSVIMMEARGFISTGRM